MPITSPMTPAARGLDAILRRDGVEDGGLASAPRPMPATAIVTRVAAAIALAMEGWRRMTAADSASSSTSGA